MSRIITLSFPASNTQLLLSTTVAGGGATASIPLNTPYPFIFTALARTITLTSTDNLSAVNFTISGTNQFGVAISEVLAGPNNNTVTSVNQYNTITNISSSGVYTNFSIGSGSTGTFQWINLDILSSSPPVVSLTGEVTGTINYSINQTNDLLEKYLTAGASFTYEVNTTPISFPITASLTNATTNQIYDFFAAVAIQTVVNSSTGGTLTVNIKQQGL